jgi:hypothetical protein
MNIQYIRSISWGSWGDLGVSRRDTYQPTLHIFQPDSMYSTYSTYLHASWHFSLRPRGDSMAKRGSNQQSSSILAKTLRTATPKWAWELRTGLPFWWSDPKTDWGDAAHTVCTCNKTTCHQSSYQQCHVLFPEGEKDKTGNPSVPGFSALASGSWHESSGQIDTPGMIGANQRHAANSLVI